jgi:hypothetical protein
MENGTFIEILKQHPLINVFNPQALDILEYAGSEEITSQELICQEFVEDFCELTKALLLYAHEARHPEFLELCDLIKSYYFKLKTKDEEVAQLLVFNEDDQSLYVVFSTLMSRLQSGWAIRASQQTADSFVLTVKKS